MSNQSEIIDLTGEFVLLHFPGIEVSDYFKLDDRLTLVMLGYDELEKFDKDHFTATIPSWKKNQVFDVPLAL